MNISRWIKLSFIVFIIMFTASCSGIRKHYLEGAGLPALPQETDVYITKEKDVADCKVIKIADIKVSKKTYGGASSVNHAMRVKARKLGGNAVLGYNFWVSPGVFAWAAPHCEGTVVKAEVACLKKVTTPISE